MLLGHLGMHRLDHHDRVVHHDADREDHREERDQVDRETHQPQDEEGPDQRHRNREGRDQRGSQIPEEHVDHEGHQDERLEQGVQHLLDRGVQELGDVVGEFVVHPGREGFLLDLLELRLDLLDDLGGVGAGGLLENDGRRGMPVDVRVNVEELGAQLDLADVLEPQDLPIGIGFQNDVFILLWLVEAPDIGQHVLFRLRRLPRGLAESSGRADHALFREGLHDVLGGHVVGPHAVGIRARPASRRCGCRDSWGCPCP